MNERELFIQARRIADSHQRSAFLAEACGTDTALRQKVDSLLEAHARAGSFLEPAAAGIAATVDPARRVFVLQASPELIATATQRFNAGDALVEPRSFAYARRFLRRALDRP